MELNTMIFYLNYETDPNRKVAQRHCFSSSCCTFHCLFHLFHCLFQRNRWNQRNRYLRRWNGTEQTLLFHLFHCFRTLDLCHPEQSC